MSDILDLLQEVVDPRDGCPQADLGGGSGGDPLRVTATIVAWRGEYREAITMQDFRQRLDEDDNSFIFNINVNISGSETTEMVDMVEYKYLKANTVKGTNKREIKSKKGKSDQLEI